MPYQPQWLECLCAMGVAVRLQSSVKPTDLRPIGFAFSYKESESQVRVTLQVNCRHCAVALEEVKERHSRVAKGHELGRHHVRKRHSPVTVLRG